MLVCKRLIGTCEPALGRREVPRPEKVQPRLGIPFFGGEFLGRSVERRSWIGVGGIRRAASIETLGQLLPKGCIVELFQNIWSAKAGDVIGNLFDFLGTQTNGPTG